MSPIDRLFDILRGAGREHYGESNVTEAENFIAAPHARAAVLLRRWDDDAKVEGAAIPSLERFRSALETCLLTATARVVEA